MGETRRPDKGEAEDDRRTTRMTSRRHAAGFALALAAVLTAVRPAPAAGFEMGAPLDCVFGETCFVQQYVDRDPGPGATDHRCTAHSYDRHKGVDFGLPSLAAIEDGVRVLAVAPGVVRARRDGVGDGEPPRDGRECGNGVLIDHADGWSTQYCHMRRGSVRVRTGDAVAAGDPLGEVGLSGKTEFPHLHVTLRKDGEVVDPFDGRPMASPCSTDGAGAPLWAPGSGVVYTPGGTLAAGMLDHLPDYRTVKKTAPTQAELAADAPAIVFWAHFYGLETGDVITLSIAAPDGETLVANRHVMAKNRATQFRATGRKRPAGGWPAGTYQGAARLIRGGRLVAQTTATVAVR
jgi:hypothetical protein